MDNITIKVVDVKAPEYRQVWELREEVLRKPLGMSLKNENLDMDNEDDIFVALEDDRAIGCLILHHLNDTTIKFRQMAVYNEWQGKDVGRKLMLAAEKFAAGKGYKKVSLHARMVAAGFYSRLGYQPEGAEFTEVGITHVLMVKAL